MKSEEFERKFFDVLGYQASNTDTSKRTRSIRTNSESEFWIRKNFDIVASMELGKAYR